jgi:hypothetical protein
VNLTPCRCNRSLAVLGSLFAILAACVLLAEHACRDGGGRVSDAAWTCEAATGASASLWTLVSPGTIALVAITVGFPVFLALNAVGRRFIVACGLRAD